MREHLLSANNNPNSNFRFNTSLLFASSASRFEKWYATSMNLLNACENMYCHLCHAEYVWMSYHIIWSNIVLVWTTIIQLQFREQYYWCRFQYSTKPAFCKGTLKIQVSNTKSMTVAECTVCECLWINNEATSNTTNESSMLCKECIEFFKKRRTSKFKCHFIFTTNTHF